MFDLHRIGAEALEWEPEAPIRTQKLDCFEYAIADNKILASIESTSGQSMINSKDFSLDLKNSTS